MNISKSIITNIGEDVVLQFLRTKNITKEELESGQDIEYLIANLIDARILDKDEVKEFFFSELMFGKRTRIRVYNLDECREILYEEDWLSVLYDEYDVESLEFNNIISTIPSNAEQKKIVAIHTEYNDRVEIKNISILFSYYITVKNVGDSCCYIPVSFDVENKLLTIKAWHRQNIDDVDRYKQGYLVDVTTEWLEANFTYTKRNMTGTYKEILYNMNKGLVEELFRKIPAYQETETLDGDINIFSASILSKISLENKKVDGEGKITIPIGVMDIHDELLKLIQRLSVADYFMTRDYDAVWNMGISAIVNKVKFKDIENVLAMVSGEDTRKPVFCSSSFLVLLKSMEQSQMVDTIWISFKYDGRTIRVNYNASNPDYFEVINLSNNRNFTQNEFDYIWEVLMRYESNNDIQIEAMDRAVVG